MFPLISLSISFWLFGFFGVPSVFFLSWFIAKLFGPIGIYLLPLIVSLYLIWVTGLIWKNAVASEGSRIWSITARIVSTGGLIIFLMICGFAWYFFRPDPFHTSRTVMSSIQKYQSHPMIGFYKMNCSENHGFVVEKASEANYFVRFCGPGGCFGKTPFFLTDFRDHPFYSIVDGNTLGIKIGTISNTSRLSEEDKSSLNAAMKDGMLLLKRCE